MKIDGLSPRIGKILTEKNQFSATFLATFRHLADSIMAKVEKSHHGRHSRGSLNNENAAPNSPNVKTWALPSGQGNFVLRSRETTATDYGIAIDRTTYDRIQGEKLDQLFRTFRRHNFLMVPVQKLPSGIQNLLA
jgi:hypothetical protein